MTSTPTTGITNQFVDIYTDLNKVSYLYQDNVGGPYGGAQSANQATNTLEISKYLGSGTNGDPFSSNWLYKDTLDDIFIYNTYLSDADVAALAVDGGAVLGVDDNNFNRSFRIYPNPTSSILNIQMVNDFEEAEVYNLQGQKLLTSNTKNIDVTNLSSGVYIVKVLSTTGSSASKRFIKQ